MRQRHYVNRVGPGETGFFTTTALDFAHLFSRPEMKEATTLVMLRYFLREQVRLHAFAMMSHHLHFVATMPIDEHGNDIVQVLKSSSARKLRPLLIDEELEALARQDGLNRHSFWKRGYRSTRLFTSKFGSRRSTTRTPIPYVPATLRMRRAIAGVRHGRGSSVSM